MHRIIAVFLLTMLIAASGTAFSAEGDRDASFGTSGVVTFNSGSNDAAQAVALQLDGKIIVAGTISNGTNTNIMVLRLNANGSRDTTFGVSGTRVIDNGTNDAARGVAVQADGKIVVVGQTFNGTNNDVLVMRLNSNGLSDATFGLSGIATINLGGNEAANAVALVTVGNKIVIAGTASNGINNDLLVMRLNSNGTLDTTFSTDGVFTLDQGGNDSGRSVAVQANGAIVAAGTTSNGLNTDLMVVRLLSGGAQDITFSGDGIAVVDRGGNDTGNAVAIQANGSIVVAGSSSAGANTDIIVVRFDAVGTPDATFNALFHLGSIDVANAVAVQTTGQIVVTGSSSNASDRDLVVLKFNATGTLDSTFGTNGVVVRQRTAASDDIGNAIAVLPDGRVLVAGSSSGGLNNDIIVLRLTSAGILDTTFNTDGVFTFAGRANTADAGNAVGLQANGRIVVVGQTSNGSNNDVLIMRFTADGRRDTLFSSDGIATFNGPADDDDTARAVAIQPLDSKIVVVGQTANGVNNDALVMRFNTDGTLDTSFSDDGIIAFNGAANNEDGGNGVAAQADGKIIVAGQSSNGTDNDLIVLRFNADGTPDATFGTGGVAVFDSGSEDIGRAVAIQPLDGKIIVVGQTLNAGGNTDVLVARFNTDGNLDLTFGSGGIVSFNDLADNNDAGRAVAVQADGKIVITGLSSNGTKNRVLVARFTSAGILDATFNAFGATPGVARFNSSGPGDDIGNAVAVQADNKIVVAGLANGTDALLLRFKDDGTLDETFDSRSGSTLIGNGVQTFNGAANGDDTGRGIAIQPDGKIVVAGVSNNDVLVLRYVGQKVRVLTPNGGGAPVPAGSLFDVTWSAPPKADHFTVELSLNNGVTWIVMAENVPGNLATIPAPTPVNNRRSCKIRVTGFDITNARLSADASDGVFTIEVVKLTFPNGGELFTSGDLVTITWTNNTTKRPVDSIRLSYSLNDGVTWKPIDTTADPLNDGSFVAWTVPAVSRARQARVRVVLKDSNNITLGNDKSDSLFTIQP